MDRRKTSMSESVSSELYDLELVETTCLENGLSCNRICDSEIEVTIAPNMILVIANTENGADTFFGFRDVPSHSHGRLVLMTGESTYVEYDPSDVLLGVLSGLVIVVSQYRKGQLEDGWLAHRDEKMDLRYKEPDEEIRIYRVGDRDAATLSESRT